MEHLVKRLSYLSGLSDGLHVNESSKEGQVLSEVIQVLNEMYEEVKSLHTRIDECEDYVEAVDEDLSSIEYEFYVDDDDLYEDIDDDDCDYILTDESGGYYDLDDSEDAFIYETTKNPRRDQSRSYEIECPSCNEMLFFLESKDDGFLHYYVEPLASLTEPINPT